MKCAKCKSALAISGNKIAFCGECGEYTPAVNEAIAAVEALRLVSEGTLSSINRLYETSRKHYLRTMLMTLFLVFSMLFGASYYAYAFVFVESETRTLGTVAGADDYGLSQEAYDLYLSGQYLAQQAEYSEAVAQYRQALTLDPESVFLREAIAFLYSARLQDSASARDVYREILRLDPKNANAYYNLGIIYRKLGNLASAAEHLRLAVRFSPEDKYAYYYLAQTYLDTGDIGAAVEAVDAAIRIDPDNALFKKLDGELYR